MKRLFVAFVLIITTVFAHAEDGNDYQCNYGGNQQEMNACAVRDFKVADAELNIVYKKLLANLSVKQKAKLKAEQRGWLANRDPDCRTQSAESLGGSVWPLDFYSCLERMTRARVSDLKTWPIVQSSIANLPGCNLDDINEGRNLKLCMNEVFESQNTLLKNNINLIKSLTKDKNPEFYARFDGLMKKWADFVREKCEFEALIIVGHGRLLTCDNEELYSMNQNLALYAECIKNQDGEHCPSAEFGIP